MGCNLKITSKKKVEYCNAMLEENRTSVSQIDVIDISGASICILIEIPRRSTATLISAIKMAVYGRCTPLFLGGSTSQPISLLPFAFTLLGIIGQWLHQGYNDSLLILSLITRWLAIFAFPTYRGIAWTHTH